jgi:hypothetical protein
MTFLTWLVRVVIVAFILRAVLRVFGGGQPRPRTRRKKVERAGGTLVRDPQCGTYLPQNRAVSIGAGSTVTYFCSKDCRDAYVSADGGGVRAGGPTA